MIREFTMNDLDQLMHLWLETNINAHHFIDKSYWQDNYDTVKDMLVNSTIFVYEDVGNIAGFVGLMNNCIAGIFVNMDYQSKGIGKILLDYVKENNPELSLAVYKKNLRALKFYLRENFIISKEQIDEQTNEVELVMDWKKSNMRLY